MATRTSTKSRSGKGAKGATTRKSSGKSTGSRRGAGKKASQTEESGVLGSLMCGLLFVALTWGSCEIASMPSREEIAELGKRFPQKTALMRAREREARRQGTDLEMLHEPVEFSAISPRIIDALVASEDARFFSHEGVDWREMKAAVEQSAKEGTRLRGASTLTQQLAKNLYLSERRSPVRKLKELWITRDLEQAHSKERLLALYLNSVEWGDGVFGVQAASRVWFGKRASEVTLGEAAALVAMLPNPRRIGPSAHESWKKRTDRVLRRLTAEGKVTQKAADQAAAELARMVF